MVTYPEFRFRTCEDCKKWMYREDGTIIMYKGKNLPRPSSSSPPCFKCPKCLGREKNPLVGSISDMSEKNQKTLQRYYEYLVSPFPIDNITRRNFGIIKRVISEIDFVNKKMLLTTIRRSVKNGG